MEMIFFMPSDSYFKGSRMASLVSGFDMIRTSCAWIPMPPCSVNSLPRGASSISMPGMTSRNTTLIVSITSLAIKNSVAGIIAG